jgi:hypothetical protein
VPWAEEAIVAHLDKALGQDSLELLEPSQGRGDSHVACKPGLGGRMILPSYLRDAHGGQTKYRFVAGAIRITEEAR